MLAMRGAIAGDSAVQRAHREWRRTWVFKHPSPWDYMFFMNTALKRDLGWFGYYWLFTTESVDESIQKSVTGAGGRTAYFAEVDHPVRSKPITEFARRRSRVSVEADRAFRLMPIST